ncbi:DNA (cytosine-5-)-methyltransferase [uncultured Draconibacterium sp.]|uniref:DNA cytosine methyltransferase n=1 Tax=uncultured Draconibacterium sp. TaxID=1573823 RepID=UPI002AA6F6BB|nr:DNA (cytosine-5-)-methyltransferase [uncultured Draconibacterium sp.]
MDTILTKNLHKSSEHIVENCAVVDLFCGIGGLSHGFVQQEFNVIAGIDIDESCKFVYEANNNASFLKKDVAELKGEELQNLFPKGKVKVLVGCAPCQPFSSYSFKVKKPDESKWKLLYSYARLIEETLPEIISMENVPSLISFKKDNVFESFVNVLTKNGYHVWHKIVYAPDYGIPQVRKRLVLLASRLGPIRLIPPTHKPENYLTVRDVIKDLPALRDGETDKNDLVHSTRELSILNKKRIRATPEGGGWKDWDQSLLLDCHKKKTGQTYSSVYGRMKWDEPAPTMTTQCIGLGNGRFGHPEQNRAISAREAAIFQSFPVDYKFIENEDAISLTNLAKHIGNAVPVKLGEAIAISIKKHLQEFNE